MKLVSRHKQKKNTRDRRGGIKNPPPQKPFVLASQFHVYLPWGQSLFSPSGGLLRDCTTSPMDRFTALLSTSPPIQLLPRGLAGQHLNKWLSLLQLDQLCTFYVYYFIYSQSGQKCPEKLRRMRWKLKRKHTCHDN